MQKVFVFWGSVSSDTQREVKGKHKIVPKEIVDVSIRDWNFEKTSFVY